MQKNAAEQPAASSSEHPVARSQDRDLKPKQTGTSAERMLKTAMMKLLMKPVKLKKLIMPRIKIRKF